VGNYYIHNQISTTTDIENCNGICFLFSTNTKLECALLNVRLRLKHKTSVISFFSLGRVFLNNTSISFVNLNIKSLLLLLEGKTQKLAFLFIKSFLSLIIIGESLKNRCFDVTLISEFIKNNFSKCKIIFLNTAANTEGVTFLNIKNKIKNKKKYFVLY